MPALTKRSSQEWEAHGSFHKPKVFLFAQKSNDVVGEQDTSDIKAESNLKIPRPLAWKTEFENANRRLLMNRMV